MLTTKQIQEARNQLVREIDVVFDELLKQQEKKAADPLESKTPEEYDRMYPLSYPSGSFKGQKPTAVIFGRERVAVSTWKKVFKEVMERCNADTNKHQALMNLRSKASGRTREFLSDRPDGMRSPLQIDHKLYAETHYDTETLLRILLQRILDPVGFDYGNIYVTVRND